MDIFKLFDREELKNMDDEAIKARTDEVMLFDAYAEQEKNPVRYAGAKDLRGLENVLYQCPHCLAEHTVTVEGKDTLRCTACGYEQRGDAYGFLHNEKGLGPAIRHVSRWSREIYNRLKEKVLQGEAGSMRLATSVRVIDEEKRKFVEIGKGEVSVGNGQLCIEGTLRGEQTAVSVPMTNFASLPFSPGKYFEIQQGEATYRCYPEDGRHVMKFVNLVKIHYELNTATRKRPKRTHAEA